MLEVEAHWVAEALDRLETGKLSPLLNLGSATLEFRQQVQPWIDRCNIRPTSGERCRSSPSGPAGRPRHRPARRPSR